jgi:hypothetical protein
VPSLLKQADEQTVAGLSAVYQACHDYRLDLTMLTGWGVIAAPQLLGRNAIVAVLERFAEEGAWGISPHLIPHRTLHSVSGTISQALRLRGPNFGVGGGPGAAAEALLVAAALLADRNLPGLWVVMTGSVPAPDEVTESPAAKAWEALALAMTPINAQEPSQGTPGTWLGIGTDRARSADGSDLGSESPFSVANLVIALAGGRQSSVHLWRLPFGGWLKLHRRAAGPEGST